MNQLRLLPSVDRLLQSDAFAPLLKQHGRDPVVAAVRRDLDAARHQLGDGGYDDPERHLSCEACAQRVATDLAARTRPHYPRALNATGVVLHTGLGRAPLAKEAQTAIAEAARSYAVLEIERDTGRRGQRDTGIAALLAELCASEAATVVNNNAGATLIALAALAAGRPVIVSRGQLVEIGGSYRIPDVMAQSGAEMLEVGTTNRTHLRDYAQALDARPDAALILRVHTSNFRIEGFTQEVPIEDLCALGRERGVPVMDDLGSGSLVDLAPFGLEHEPLVERSLTAGAGVVTFSGDKLLGGPQAGLIAGSGDLVGRIRRHPLYRALRPDKLTLAGLEATLDLYRDRVRALKAIPVLRALTTSQDRLQPRAEWLSTQLHEVDGLKAFMVEETSKVGGGSFAVESLPTWAVAVETTSCSVDALAAALREGDPAVFARIHDGRLLLDPRTLLSDEEDREVVGAVRRAVARLARR